MSGTQSILIVDDDRFLLDMYATKFKQAGFKVEVAGTGEEAINKLQAGFSPSAILLDVVMPGIDGIELLEKIRAQKLAPGAALIVLSNQGLSTDIDRAKRLGIDGYIVKAHTIPSEVLEQVADIIKEKAK